MKTLYDFINFDDVTDMFRGSYVKTIFDRIQTHALYGIGVGDVDKAKSKLHEIGARRFRLVKTDYGFVILCFKITPNKVKNN
jgi:hypothetical protein